MLAHERGEAAPPEAHVPARRPRRVRERGGALVQLFERRSTVDLFWLWLRTVGDPAPPPRHPANPPRGVEPHPTGPGGPGRAPQIAPFPFADARNRKTPRLT